MLIKIASNSGKNRNLKLNNEKNDRKPWIAQISSILEKLKITLKHY